MGAATATVRLRVVPGARKPGIVGRYGDGWKVRVAPAPEDGKANEAVLALLAASLDVPRRSVSLASGDRARDKTVVIAGMSHGEAARRLGETSAKSPAGRPVVADGAPAEPAP